MRVARKAGGTALGAAFALGTIAWVPVAAQSAAATLPSAIGNVRVNSISVSPLVARTGLVVVFGSVIGCQSDCMHLWRSRDGGATWQIAKGVGWTQRAASVVVGADNVEELYAGGDNGIIRSLDGGDTWTAMQPPGAFITPAPSFPRDGLMTVVSGSGDYAVRGASVTRVAGSGGADVDEGFAFSAAYPQGGAHAPALLVGVNRKTGKPGVLQCDASLTCQGPDAVIAVPDAYGMAVTLYPSQNFANDGEVWAQSAEGIYRSTDGGHSFVAVPVGFSGVTSTSTPELVLSPSYGAGGNRTAYTAVLQIVVDKVPAQQTNTRAEGGIFRTADGGVSWQALGGSESPFARGALAVGAGPSGLLFGAYLQDAGHGGLLCSRDDGHTWAVACGAAAGQPVTGVGGQRGGAAAGSTVPGGNAPTASESASGDAVSGRTSSDATLGAVAAATSAGGTPGAGRLALALVAVLVSLLGVVAIRARWASRRRDHAPRRRGAG